jgi:hypothetical protein
MNLPDPFAYSTAPHIRRHGPKGYVNYQSYKPFLRDEFAFRCVYCLERELWYPDRAASFSADHVDPKAMNPVREQDYENLVYSCTRCNSRKMERMLALDPALIALGDHLHVGDDGEIEDLTSDGWEWIRIFNLNVVPSREIRRDVLLMLEAKRDLPDHPGVHALFLRRFGYPDDLPDLKKLKPPSGNSRPEGIENSHHSRRMRGELPEVY